MRAEKQGTVENVTDSGRKPSQAPALEISAGRGYLEIREEITSFGDLSPEPVTYITTGVGGCGLC
jgi:hypothetical protein